MSYNYFRTNDITSADFNGLSSYFQLRLNFDIEILFPVDDKVQLVNEMVSLGPSLRLVIVIPKGIVSSKSCFYFLITLCSEIIFIHSFVSYNH